MKGDNAKLYAFFAVCSIVGCICGYYLLKFFVYLGANHVTMKDVAATYIFSWIGVTLLFGLALLKYKR